MEFYFMNFKKRHSLLVDTDTDVLREIDASDNAIRCNNKTISLSTSPKAAEYLTRENYKKSF